MRFVTRTETLQPSVVGVEDEMLLRVHFETHGGQCLVQTNKSLRMGDSFAASARIACGHLQLGSQSIIFVLHVQVDYGHGRFFVSLWNIFLHKRRPNSPPIFLGRTSSIMMSFA